MVKFFRLLRIVIKTSKLESATTALLVLFLACAVVVSLVEPGIANYGDALWYLFEAVTTIGFGDYAAVTAVGRIVTAVLSLCSVFYLALITGAFVNFTSELLKRSANESALEFLDRLEHLDELSQDELREVSAKVKEYRVKRG